MVSRNKKGSAHIERNLSILMKTKCTFMLLPKEISSEGTHPTVRNLYPKAIKEASLGLVNYWERCQKCASKVEGLHELRFTLKVESVTLRGKKESFLCMGHASCCAVK
jgi:hypothetical protein